MALDKNCIDTTTFDILQPAIDYYIKHGTPDEQLRTYYYQGRIYQNQGDDDSAMCSFMNGSDLGENITDSLLLAHTLVAQGTLYFKQYKTDEFIHNNEEAARLYGANQCFAHNLLKNQKKTKNMARATDSINYLEHRTPSQKLPLVSAALPSLVTTPFNRTAITFLVVVVRL